MAWAQVVAHPAEARMLEVTIKLKISAAQLRALILLLVLVFF
jgi:hypothetical protein